MDFDIFEGYVTRQAYPFDLIYFRVPESKQADWGSHLVGVQTNWERKTNPKEHTESERIPTPSELMEFAVDAANKVNYKIVDVIDGVSSFIGLTERRHTMTLNNYKKVTVSSRTHPDLYFEISKMIRSSPNGKFGHPYELLELTQLLKKEGLI